MTTIKELQERIGGPLSKVSKMPGLGFSLPAQRCRTGSKLAKVKGSVCSTCYALKGRYIFPNVKKGLENRYQALQNNPTWEFDMLELIRRKETSGHFRIHPSGDIDSVGYLRKWVFIAENLPDIKFWAPTREVGIVKRYLDKYKSFPKNLVIRVSNHMVDGHKFHGKYTNTSSVITSIDKAKGKHICHATLPDGNHKCGDCRKCWDKRIKNINYLKH